MRTLDVVGVGANSLDLVYVLPEYPRPDSASAKLRIQEHRISSGGQTATAIATCAALGLRPAYIGAFGDDAHGTRLREELTRRGVDLTHAVVRPAPNRYAVILIDARHGERVVLWQRDDRLALHPAEVPDALLASATVVHVDDEDPAIAIDVARRARAAGAIVTSDIEHLTPRTRELIDAVSVPVFAEHLAPATTGETDVERAMQRLRQPHHTLLVATLGARGAVALEGDRIVRVPACAVDVVDTTGAGDVFRGALIDGLIRGLAVEPLLRFANAAAALACTRHGAMGGVPHRAEIEELSASRYR